MGEAPKATSGLSIQVDSSLNVFHSTVPSLPDINLCRVLSTNCFGSAQKHSREIKNTIMTATLLWDYNDTVPCWSQNTTLGQDKCPPFLMNLPRERKIMRQTEVE